MKKGIFILTLLILALFSVSYIYAADVNDTLAAGGGAATIETVQSDDNNDISISEDSQAVEQSDDDEAVNAENDLDVLSDGTGTWSDLCREIGNGGDIINLTKSYYRYDFDQSVSIINPLVINGNGAVIDMAGSHIAPFSIVASNVTLKNLTIKNINCDVYDNAIYWLGDGATVSDCTFINNTAKGYDGGAIYLNSDGATVSNCTFINNTAGRYGGAIYWYGDSGRVSNCTFINNTANYGGAIYWQGGGGSVSYSTFINNTANNEDHDGTSIYMESGSVSYSTFLGNPYYFYIHAVSRLYVDYCWFGNTAEYYNRHPNTNGNIRINWLFLNATANPDAISASKTSDIIFKLYLYNSTSRNITECDNTPFKNLNLTLTATNGNVSKNIAKLGESIQFTPTKNGNATVSTTIENIAQTVEIAVGDGDFDLLQDLVDNESLSVINLERNYTFNQFDTMTDGVRITRSITINGNGYTIDAQGKARVFNVQARDVTINNLTIKNANYNGDGEAVYFAESGSVINCNFINNTANRGGAIYFETGCTGRLENCNFTNNTARYGGAIFFISSDTTIEVRNCNFINNSASEGGGALFMSSGTVTNCNFTNNTAISAGAVYFRNNCNVTNCNFINNSASEDAGAIIVSGTVTNCNFVDNKATINGGALFMISGTVTNCNFTNNSASDSGGAIYHGPFDERLTVSNCNFTGNNASWGSAIWVSQSYTTNLLTISNSIFLNNRANAESLDVVKNDNNITITFTGNDNLLNAIYSSYDAEVTFTNVTYWGANGITNTDDNYPSRSNKEAGQNITIKGFVNGNILNTVKTTDTDGKIVLENVGEYYITVCHDDDSYYTEAETISTNMKYYVNVTETETTNKTVNITAKSNIYNEVMSGKLLFILPNGENVTANYAGNGTWWALHTFNDYGEYKVNATYVGLDNVTINNATIKVKLQTQLSGNAITATYNVNKNLIITLKDSNGNPISGASITVDLNGAKTYTTDKNGQVKVSTKGLAPKAYTAKITFKGNVKYVHSSKEIKIVIKKAKPKITAKKKTYKAKKKVKKFTITLKDNKGKAIKNAKVTLKAIKIKKTSKKQSKKTGKKNILKAKTNKKGKATFKINRNKKGKYQVIIKYKGNKYYTPVTKKVKITIK